MRDTLKVYHSITNHISSDHSTVVWASVVTFAHKHGDRDLVNASDINEIRLAMSSKIVIKRDQLLEPVGISVLLPMKRTLHGHRLAVGAAEIITADFAKLIADALVLFLPIGAVLIIDTDRVELV